MVPALKRLMQKDRREFKANLGYLLRLFKKTTNIKGNRQRENLKLPREKCQVTYKETSIRPKVDICAETLWVRKEWEDVLKVLKEKT